jgi:hypothetical protein
MLTGAIETETNEQDLAQSVAFQSTLSSSVGVLRAQRTVTQSPGRRSGWRSEPQPVCSTVVPRPTTACPSFQSRAVARHSPPLSFALATLLPAARGWAGALLVVPTGARHLPGKAAQGLAGSSQHGPRPHTHLNVGGLRSLQCSASGAAHGRRGRGSGSRPGCMRPSMRQGTGTP